MGWPPNLAARAVHWPSEGHIAQLPRPIINPLVVKPEYSKVNTIAITHWPLGRSNSKSIIFTLIIQNRSLDTHCELALMWLPRNATDEKSTLVKAMAWYLVREQAITYANVDLELWCHMASMGHNEWKQTLMQWQYCKSKRYTWVNQSDIGCTRDEFLNALLIGPWKVSIWF